MSVKLDALEQEKQSNESKLTKELTEHKSLVEDLTGKLNAQQASKESIQSELESVTNDFEETRSKVNALSSELATKEEALKSSHQKLTIQHKELNEQIKTLNSDLKTLNEDRNSLKNKITDNDVLLKTRTEVISKLENDIKSESQRNSELEKQVSELTRAYEEKLTAKDKESKKISNSLVETQKALQVQSDSNADLLNALEITNAEYELLKMHMAQLQYELEVTHEQLKTTKYSSEILKNKVSDFDNITNKLACETREKMSAHEKVTKLLDKNKDLQEQYTTLMEEKRSTEEKLAAERQTAKGVVHNTEKMTTQLTQERELTKRLQHEKNELQEQLNTFEVAMNNQSEYQQVELELASLQINQLQDELEYYFAALKNAHTQSREPSEVPKYYQDVFSKATSDSLTINGKYTTDGYNDAHLLLTDVQLADGRVFKELPIKLINVGGHVAIEFREDEDGSLFTHYEDMTDEYGPYLRFFANPSEASLAQQELVDSRMTASERIMVMSCILLIADLIQEQDVTCIADFSNEEWRNWRLTAFRLAETVQQAPSRLSFDTATLKEEYRIDNYEHLWLAFDSVLIGGVWRNNLELKVAARNVSNDDDDIFSDDISLEFRELDDGSAPLVTWPPVEADEYGPKFVVFLNGLDDLNKLAFSDRSLIEQIAKNLSSIVDKIDDKSSKLVRSKGDWKKAINALLEGSNDAASQQVKDSPYSFVLDEVISMGTYEHILFVEENSNTKVKLKAKDINLETLFAEIFIELRNGSNEIIYNDTEFFGEDEYGPRVLVPFEVLLSDLIPNQREQFVWLIDVYEQVLKLIAGGSEIEPLVKKQWINMLNNQLEINS
ncbi:hypothetical protein [Alteromonas sp. KUL49]|uniref:hypothetical protein n=1 Tax=Alteromonas sp. KUL49 TaxID=2480798 RepID=UPI00102F220C|nr:hypothetical protein [Alteromonas sp. KUL49]TAP37897.1 hypothetical protein EYS00_15475 [Alteromonas sp. KUL49]GEA12758.1 hypothetical protein KUL49_31330 [Alteromonas sp. KUL49]